MSKKFFYFTLGPVQSFVAQARRTKDFYAASFMLSWLAGVAILAVEKQGGTIKFPKADKAFLDWMKGNGKDPAPLQGSIPNRFMAEVSTDFNPDQVVKTVKGAWQALATAVWDGDIKELPVDVTATAAVWAGQVDHFFEITWALADTNTESNLLDRRKNWRIHAMPAQAGIKCQTIEGLQELSGSVRPEASERDKFWQALRGKINNKNDLRQGEYLCAIAWIKRRFIHYFETFDQSVEGIPLKGWKLNNQVPSVAYLAALPWLANVLELATQDPTIEKAYADFYQAAQRIADHDGWQVKFPLVDHWAELLEKKAWAKLDGSVFFEEQLESRFLEKDEKNKTDNQKDIDAVKIALKGLLKKSNLQAPSPFYAVLLMDGDSLGKQMSDLKKQPIITDALERFTKGVPEIVIKNNGFLIYAGGDDVLALLPVEDALTCAAAIRAHYLKSFEDAKKQAIEQKISTSEAIKEMLNTISAAIIYAHIKMPLLKPLAAAHPLLDDIAKDSTGRDAIAVQVLKPGGEALLWTLPWEVALDGQQKDQQMVLMQLFQDIQDKKLIFANKFFYEIRELFDLLNPKEAEEKTATATARNLSQKTKIETASLLNNEQKLKILAAEYVRSGAVEKRKPSLQDAEALLQRLISQCLCLDNKPKDQKDQKDQPNHVLTADAALLLRFLLQKSHAKKDISDVNQNSAK